MGKRKEIKLVWPPRCGLLSNLPKEEQERILAEGGLKAEMLKYELSLPELLEVDEELKVRLKKEKWG